MMKGKKNQFWINFCKIVFTVFFVYMLLKLVDIQEVITLYSQLSFSSILICVFLCGLINVGRTMRFIIINEKKVRFFRMLPVVVVHGFYNRVLPFRIGEGIFPYLMNKYEGVSVSDSLASIITVRVYDLISSFLLFVIAYLICIQNYSKSICILLFVLMFILSLFFLYYGMVIFTLLFKTSVSHNKIIRKIQDVVDAKKEKLSFKNSIVLLLISIANWILMFLIFMVVIYNFGYNVLFEQVVFAGSFSNISSILPVSSFGNFGTMELGWSSILLSVGYTYEDAMLLGFSVNLCTFLLTAAFGIIGMIYFKLVNRRRINKCS